MFLFDVLLRNGYILIIYILITFYTKCLNLVFLLLCYILKTKIIIFFFFCLDYYILMIHQMKYNYYLKK